MAIRFIERRRFITILGGAAAFPLAARAQQSGGMRRIGVLMAFAESDPQARVVHRRIPARDFRSLGGRRAATIASMRAGRRATRNRRQRFAKELVALQPDLILSQATPTTAALAATNAQHPDRVRSDRRSGRQRFRREHSAPGRQRHRFHRQRGLDGRQVAGAAQGDRAARQSRRIPVQSPGNDDIRRLLSEPVQSRGCILRPLRRSPHPFATASELESAIAALAREPNGGLIAMPNSFMINHRAEVTSLAARYRLPAVYYFRGFAELGGLLSYGNDLTDNYRRARAMPTASSRARSRASFRSRRRSSSSW